MKQYSQKRTVQQLAHEAEVAGITHFIISPGSRNAPLAIHFSAIDAFHCYSIVDERSAAFVALGMAKVLKKPVGLICTSGSAAANYYPAITEAFYQNVPLLILTADRPVDFVDLFDGQTIRQKDLYSQHCYGDFELLQDEQDAAREANPVTIRKAIQKCFAKQGPVHINIPLAEPLYELTSELPAFAPAAPEKAAPAAEVLPSDILQDWPASGRVLILCGTLDPHPELLRQLGFLVQNHSAVVLTEVNSNLYHPKFFAHTDRYLEAMDAASENTYTPDLLITIGQNVVSKKIKQFLRRVRPAKHWHIDPHWQPDTYHVLSREIRMDAEAFFKQLIQQLPLDPSPYYNLWNELRQEADGKHDQYIRTVPFSDLYLFSVLPKTVPEDYVIHFSNSSAIRYAQLFDFGARKIFCNRGTSGIDGCTSTAMGYAMASKEPVLLVTGELSFFYDINGLWNQYIPPYTRIIVFNNGGGDIFRIIPGPSEAKNALEEFIATTHHRTAEPLAKAFGFEYSAANDESTLDRMLANFFHPSARPKILEVNTASVENSEYLKQYFRMLRPTGKTK